MYEYLLTLTVAAAVTYLLTGVVRRFAVATGSVCAIRDRDVHTAPVPRLGGLAMFGGLLAGLVVAGHLSGLRQVQNTTGDLTAVLSAAVLICLLGAIDDRWGLDALTKLGGQVLVAGVLVVQGVQILWLPIPGIGTVVLDPVTGPLLTVLVIVVTINAVNFVDGLDGLAAGMVAIAAAAFFGYSYRLWAGYNLEGAAVPTLLTALLVGICLGFLPHNLYPARIFMGDSGSMLIGLLLAASTVSLTGQLDPDGLINQVGSGQFVTHKLVPVYMPLILPIAVLAVPLADLVLAVIRRTRAGCSPFTADKKHLHHRLLAIGHSHRRAVLIMYFWSALIAFATVGYSVHPNRRPIVLAAVVLMAFGLVALLAPRLVMGRPHRVPGRAAQAVGNAAPVRQTASVRPTGD